MHLQFLERQQGYAAITADVGFAFVVILLSWKIQGVKKKQKTGA